MSEWNRELHDIIFLLLHMHLHTYMYSSLELGVWFLFCLMALIFVWVEATKRQSNMYILIKIPNNKLIT